MNTPTTPQAAQVLSDTKISYFDVHQAALDHGLDYNKLGCAVRDILAKLQAAPQAAQGVGEVASESEFCWLVEHFLGDGAGNSTGHYHTGFTNLSGGSRSTTDPMLAKRYETWKEANADSVKLGHTLSGTWRAVQHGFATHPAPSPAVAVPLSQAATDVLAERQRQISAEGWAPAHDDGHGDGSLSAAASTYALAASDKLNPECRGIEFGSGRRGPSTWPWGREWWKPSTARRMLVKAGALILAEIERLDRAALTTQQAQTKGGAT